MHYLNFNEKQQHGTSDFPCAYYHVDQNHPRYHMPFHWHMESEIIRIVSGTLYLHIDDEEIAGKAGDTFFIHGGAIHGGVPENCIYECVVFDLNMLLMHVDACKRYIRKIDKHAVKIHTLFSRGKDTLSSFVDFLFHACREPEEGRPLLILGSLMSLLGMIFQQHRYRNLTLRKNMDSQKLASLKPVLEFVENHYDTPITLEELSKIAGMTPKYFCRYFQAIIHRTPIDYLNYYRIERACLKLSTTEEPIMEIGYSCGFNDVSYFIKTFKKYKTLTPKQYRNQVG